MSEIPVPPSEQPPNQQPEQSPAMVIAPAHPRNSEDNPIVMARLHLWQARQQEDTHRIDEILQELAGIQSSETASTHEPLQQETPIEHEEPQQPSSEQKPAGMPQEVWEAWQTEVRKAREAMQTHQAEKDAFMKDLYQKHPVYIPEAKIHITSPDQEIQPATFNPRPENVEEQSGIQQKFTVWKQHAAPANPPNSEDLPGVQDQLRSWQEQQQSQG